MSITSELKSVSDPILLSETSRYYLCNQYKVGSNNFFETWDKIEIPISSKDKFHTISAGEEYRWDLISYKYYGTVLYKDMICLANGIRNPFELVPAGSVIRIPSETTFYDITIGKKVNSASNKGF